MKHLIALSSFFVVVSFFSCEKSPIEPSEGKRISDGIHAAAAASGILPALKKWVK